MPVGAYKCPKCGDGCMDPAGCYSCTGRRAAKVAPQVPCPICGEPVSPHRADGHYKRKVKRAAQRRREADL
jgi:predicted RNA-binding Zn-ribbon protein involved in translation (DUF1610 family)